MHVTQPVIFPHLSLVIIFSILVIKKYLAFFGKKSLIEILCVFRNNILRDRSPRNLIQNTKFTKKKKKQNNQQQPKQECNSQKSTCQTVDIQEGFRGMLLPTGSNKPSQETRSGRCSTHTVPVLCRVEQNEFFQDGKLVLKQSKKPHGI